MQNKTIYTELLKFSGEKMKCYNGRKRNWNGWQAEDFGWCFRASSLLKMSVKIWLTSGKEILPSPPASMFANLRDASEEWLGSAAVKDLPKKCWVQYALCNLLCAALIRLTELQDLLYIFALAAVHVVLSVGVESRLIHGWTRFHPLTLVGFNTAKWQLVDCGMRRCVFPEVQGLVSLCHDPLFSTHTVKKVYEILYNDTHPLILYHFLVTSMIFTQVVH